MTTRTKHIAITALICLLVAASVVALLVREINGQGAQLTAHVSILAEHAAKEQARTRLARQAEETATERAQLSGYFLESADASIDFLTDIEALAASFGLTAATNNLTEGGTETEPFIAVEFSYRGSREQVVSFSRALEYIPYQARIESLTLSQVGGSGGWEGSTRIRVSTLSL